MKDKTSVSVQIINIEDMKRPMLVGEDIRLGPSWLAEILSGELKVVYRPDVEDGPSSYTLSLARERD